MPSLEEQVLAAVGRKGYTPLKPKALARSLGFSADDYRDFRRALKDLLRDGRLELAKNHTVRAAAPHGTVIGTYRSVGSGGGFVRPHSVEGKAGPDVRVRDGESLDAATGDTVLVRILRKPAFGDAPPAGRVVRVLERATRHFVGTYFEREGEGLVRVDGTVFSHSVYVGDPGAKGARPNDKVVIEMLRFPAPGGPRRGRHHRGARPARPARRRYAVGHPRLRPARRVPRRRRWKRPAKRRPRFDEDDLDGRDDFTNDVVITIDPVDARDFDDAVSLTQRRGDEALAAERPHRRRGPLRPARRRPGPRGPQARHQRLLAAARHPDVPGDDLQRPGQLATGPAALRQERPSSTSRRRPEDRRALRQRRHPVRQRFTYEQVSAICSPMPAKPPTAGKPEPK